METRLSLPDTATSLQSDCEYRNHNTKDNRFSDCVRYLNKWYK